jgi:hypothetical protein
MKVGQEIHGNDRTGVKTETAKLNWPTIPRTVVSTEHSYNDDEVGETEIQDRNLPRCHFIHHKCHMQYPVIETQTLRREPCD